MAIVLAAAACANVPMADPQQDAAGKAFRAPSARHTVRSTSLLGADGALPARSTLPSRAGRAPALARRTYLRLEGPPGPFFDITCRVGDHQGQQEVMIEPGRTRFVEVSTKVGLLMPDCRRPEVLPDQGQAAVRGRPAGQSAGAIGTTRRWADVDPAEYSGGVCRYAFHPACLSQSRSVAIAPVHAYAELSLASVFYEVRGGVLAHDLHIVAANHVDENGVSLNGEVAFAPSLALFCGAIRPVLGGTATTGGGTSWGYLDARWEYSGIVAVCGLRRRRCPA